MSSSKPNKMSHTVAGERRVRVRCTCHPVGGSINTRDERALVRACPIMCSFLVSWISDGSTVSEDLMNAL